jgi:ribonuclease BN (tRNA processing enzyme)
VQYIKQVFPNTEQPVIDYALLTHYHDDHIGGLTSKTKTAVNGAYKLTGITDVGEALPIRKLIDRDYPEYNFPTDLRIAYQKEPSIFINLQRFIGYQQKNNGMATEKLKPAIRGIKTNGTIWTGQGNETLTYFTADSALDPNGRFNENPLSLAIKISYGKFDYFTGGDNTVCKALACPPGLT